MPVGLLGPIDVSVLDELTLRPGDGVMSFPDGARIDERTEDVLAQLRGER